MDSIQENKPNIESDIRYIPIKFLQQEETEKNFEIDIKGLFDKLWRSKLQIISITFLFGIVGLIFAYSSINEYTSTSKILPDQQGQSSNLGRFGGLAAQFGLGTTAGTNQNDVLSSNVYPEILSTVDLLEPLLDEIIYLEEEIDSVSVRDYYQNHLKRNLFVTYTIGLPGVLLSTIRGTKNEPEMSEVEYDYKKLSPEDFKSYINLRQAIVVDRDLQTGLISLSVTAQSREVAVQLSNLVLNRLQEYLIEYRTQKSKQNVEFIEQRFADVKLKFLSAQNDLGEFSDQNQGMLTRKSQLIQRNLESEYSLYMNLYGSLAEQLEQAKIKLQQETPLLTVIQQPMYPYAKSSPSKLSYLIMITAIGFFISILWVFFGDFIGKFFTNNKIKESVE